eukprot:757876-Hanusia_phi.AAC.2
MNVLSEQMEIKMQEMYNRGCEVLEHAKRMDEQNAKPLIILSELEMLRHSDDLTRAESCLQVGCKSLHHGKASQKRIALFIIVFFFFFFFIIIIISSSTTTTTTFAITITITSVIITINININININIIVIILPQYCYDSYNHLMLSIIPDGAGQEALGRDSSSADVYVSYGYLLQRMKDTEGAQLMYQQALAIDPTNIW